MWVVTGWTRRGTLSRLMVPADLQTAPSSTKA
jgi:hypothetical protein